MTVLTFQPQPSIMSAPPDLVLDPSIRTWVVYPILAVMVLVGLLRHYLTVLMTPVPPQLPMKEQREASYLQYSGMLQANAFNLSQDSLRLRVHNLVGPMRKGEYLADPEAAPPTGMPSLTDPKSMETMIGGVRQQILNYVPQTLIMSWVSSYFGGFVVMKLPFPLTTRFKTMLQAAIATPDLDVRWVSSISWYILLLIGLNSIYALILGGDNSATQTMAQQQAMAGGLGGAAAGMFAPNADKRKIFEAEADNLELVKSKSVLTGVESRVLALSR